MTQSVCMASCAIAKLCSTSAPAWAKPRLSHFGPDHRSLPFWLQLWRHALR